MTPFFVIKVLTFPLNPPLASLPQYEGTHRGVLTSIADGSYAVSRASYAGARILDLVVEDIGVCAIVTNRAARPISTIISRILEFARIIKCIARGWQEDGIGICSAHI